MWLPCCFCIVLELRKENSLKLKLGPYIWDLKLVNGAKHPSALVSFSITYVLLFATLS